ncbi:MarR family transcriptional regulator [Enterococcus saccharolyticus]|uniref:MarR family winged helix-turn-helix transcriptional regulator n=1 Tax=Enterococcus saccharolyticus TaxID=41997 RepID=UPI001E4BA940|nr:MarR family transcriptional regulator [Enterococcus saccharolyticus]MCD5002979.1 MarR family transcriptional regulator [Enterococcus saccharolyticus]
MDKQSSSLDITVFTEIFSFMSQLVFQDFDSNLEDLKLTKMEVLIILIVATKEGISMTELATQVGTSKVQISRSIANLEKRQIVQRQHNATNRRVVNVFTTNEGKALFQQKENQVKEKLADTLSVLTKEDYLAVNEHFAGAMAILTKYKELKHVPGESPLC